MATLENLVSGHYRQAAGLVAATSAEQGPDAALVFYLTKADPLLVLRDLLGHSSVLVTEKYIRRLDTVQRRPHRHVSPGRWAVSRTGAGLADRACRNDPSARHG
jgi:hypothetical protein